MQITRQFYILKILGALGLTAVFSGLLYLFFFQSPLTSRREIAFSMLLGITLFPFTYLLISRFLLPYLFEYSPRARRNWLLLSVVVGVLFVFVTRPPDLVLLYPVHSLQVIIPAGDSNRSITLEYAKTAFRDISFNELRKEGGWQRSNTGLTHSGSEPASLTWVGRPGNVAALVFSNTPALAEIRVGWDNEITSLDPSAVSNNQVEVKYIPDIGWMNDLIPGLLTGFTIGFFFLVVTLFLARLEFKSSQRIKHKKCYWLLYALPMIAVWLVFLLTFFPGFTSEDSIVQWQQVLTGQYTDHHPLLYTLLIASVSRIYYSPSAIVVTQIIMVSLALAWGLAELESMGVSRKILWGLAALCAILPINIVAVVTFRKDLPYSAVLLILSIMLLKIINTRGAWLKQPWSWLGMGLTLGVISLTRINGLPVALGSVVLLLIFYHQEWRRLASAVGVFALALAAMYGPVYSLLNVKLEPEFGTILFLHHIAAHLEAGTPLSQEQENYLNRIAPLNRWNYDCCTIVNTLPVIFPGFTQQNFDLPILKQDIQKPTRIAMELFLSDPLVDLRHMVCVSQTVWSLQSSCKSSIISNVHFLPGQGNSIISSWWPKNTIGFVSDSKIPGLIQYAFSYLQIFSKGLLHNINYTAAIYFYLAIYCTALLSFRKRDRYILLFMSPILIQSLTLTLVIISQYVRFQYGVIFVGLLSLGFLFVPLGRSNFDLSDPLTKNMTGAAE